MWPPTRCRSGTGTGRRRTASPWRTPSRRSSPRCATASRCDPVPEEPSLDQVFAGVPDAFGRLWTPHRLAYIKGENKPSSPGEGEECPFDRAPKLSDEDGLIVARGTLVYAVLNLYPYNAGHVLVCPYRHVADYTDLTQAETAEFSGFTKRAVRALRHASAAQGFNIGIHLGSVP